LRIWKRLGRPAWTTIGVLLLLVYGALLRLDSYTGKYGTLDHPAWARIATRDVAPLAAKLRPPGVVWVRDYHPYVGGDPINYLRYAREMTAFYQPHVREPVFLELTRFGLWTMDGQDAGISVASAIGSLLVIVATFLLGRALVSPAAGLIAAAIMTVEFEAIRWSVDGWRDDTFAGMFVLTAWTLVRLRDRPTTMNAILAGVIGGLTCLTRVTALSFIVPALIWIAIDGREGRRVRAASAALAFALTAAVVLPFLISCAIGTGDPFFAINYHTVYYRASEGQAIGEPMTAGTYIRQKFTSHPIATADIAAVGLFVRPFVTKWIGVDVWTPLLTAVLWWSSLIGLAMWPFTSRGRLMLVVLLSSLLPYAFTWNIGGGGQWRFTMHVYSVYVVAAVYAWSALARPWWRAPARGLATRVAVVAAVALAGAVAYVSLPWFVAREAVAGREAVNVETGARDWIFYRRGWTPPRQEGAVTIRVSLDAQTTVHFPLTEKRSYDVVLRFDPAAPDTQRRVTILLNRQMLGTVLTSFNPERVGSYRLRLPEAAVRAGDNAITLVPDTRVTAAAAGARFTWLDPGTPLGVRFWYLRVLE
jgi:hypothetical protein